MKKLIIVDDDNTYLSLMRRAVAMEQLNDYVFLASDAESFRQAFQDVNNKVGLVVSDVNLKGHENGFQLIDWAREIIPTLPGLLVSWTLEERSEEEARLRGCPIWLKTSSFAELRQRIKDWTEQARRFR